MISQVTTGLGNQGTPSPEDSLRGFKLDPEALKAVRSAVSSAAAYKGYPWSATEFNASSYSIREELRKKHGDEAAKAFDAALSKAPVKGGRFNPYSGD